MEKFFDLKVFGTLAVFVLVLWAIMYFSKPATTTTTPAAGPKVD